MNRLLAILFLLLAFAPVRAAESTVYRHVDADGVVSFSDQAQPGAKAIELSVPEPRAEDVERAGETYQQQLELISVLEASRRADEVEAAERRLQNLALARAQAERAAAEAAAYVQPEARYVYAPWYGPAYPIHGPRHHRPGHPEPSTGSPRIGAKLGVRRP